MCLTELAPAWYMYGACAWLLVGDASAIGVAATPSRIHTVTNEIKQVHAERMSA